MTNHTRLHCSSFYQLDALNMSTGYQHWMCLSHLRMWGLKIPKRHTPQLWKLIPACSVDHFFISIMQGCIYHNIKHIKEKQRIAEKSTTSNMQKTKASFASAKFIIAKWSRRHQCHDSVSKHLTIWLWCVSDTKKMGSNSPVDNILALALRDRWYLYVCWWSATWPSSSPSSSAISVGSGGVAAL